MATDTGTRPPFITRVVIENYKSIAHCDVPLGPLTFLVGRNGAGKSNFLDALWFIDDMLHSGLDAALRRRGSIDDLRFRGAGSDALISLQFDLALPAGMIGHYTLRLTQQQFGGYEVAEELCTVNYPASGHRPTGFHVCDGQFLQPQNGLREVPTDRLYLATSMSPFDRPVYDLLANMAFYQPIPAHMRSPQPHETGDLLLPDGSNVASVVLRMAQHQPAALERITDYLHAVLPTLQAIQAIPVGGYDALQFYQQSGDYDPMQFYRRNTIATMERPFPAATMSAGTLHALGVLVALFQGGFGEERKPAVIGIEEPEAALHPAATAVLRDAFADAAEISQVVVTTQSADLLDDKEISPEALLAADFVDGETHIGPLDEGQQSIICDHLATAGELLRTSNFQPTRASQHGSAL